MQIVERPVLNNSKIKTGKIKIRKTKISASACSFAMVLAFSMAPASAQTSETAATTSTLPRVNVVGTKPDQKPAGTRTASRIRQEPIKLPVTQTGCRAAMAPGKPYFVEFRSRGAQSYGHTFVFHGRLGGGNRFASFSVAGLHPAGDDPATYIQGHWAPVPAETGVSYGDLDEQYLTARFCVTLTEAEYRKALVFIKNLQATKKTWHAGTYNCNSFAADIAKAIGLDTPNPNMYLPERFITRLAEDNPRGKKADGGSVFSNWTQQAKQR